MITEVGIRTPILNYTTWTAGTTGTATGFTQNGATAENHRVNDNDPWGKQTVVWEARPGAVSDADGGWNTTTFNIDNTKLYRFSVWIRRTVLGNGSAYLGCNGYGSIAGVMLRSTGANNTNPYFWSGGWSAGFSSNWILIVGHIWPKGSGTGANHPDSGRYYSDGTLVGPLGSGDFVWREETTSVRHRAYLYYSTDVNTRQQFVYPRVDICDGSEPTLSELLQGYDSDMDTIWRENGINHTFNLKINENGNNKANLISELGPTTGLVSYYPLDGNAKDYSGNGNDGAITGATSTGGVDGGAYEFTVSTSNRIEVSNFSPPNSQLTVSLWLKVKSIRSDFQYALHYSRTGANDVTSSSIYAGVNNANHLILTLGSIDIGGVWNSGTTNIGVSLNTWQLLSATWDGSVVRVYLDGAYIKQYAMTSFENTAQTFRVGAHPGQVARDFNGMVDDVRIYNRALTAEEVKILYDMYNPSSTSKVKLTNDTVYCREIKEEL